MGRHTRGLGVAALISALLVLQLVTPSLIGGSFHPVAPPVGPPVAAAQALPGATPTPPLPHGPIGPRGPRIVGGQVAASGQFPFAAFLIFTDPDDNGTYQCGGTLIAPTWVMTAAHCATRASGAPLAPGAFAPVRIGGTDVTTSTGWESRSVVEVVVHPQFGRPSNPNPYDDDVALLRLAAASTKPTLPLIQPGEVGTLDTTGAVATTVGWGYTSESGSASSVLRYVEINVLADSSCQSAYSSSDTPYNAQIMICAGVTGGGKDSCQGDSGGPLMVRNAANSGWVQIGIVSHGIGCARAGYPGVYTRVSAFLSFINATIGMSPPPPTATPTPSRTPTAGPPTATPTGTTGPAATPTATTTTPAGTGNLRLIAPVRVVDTRRDNAAEGIVTTGYNPDGTRITPVPLSPNLPRRFRLAGVSFADAAGGPVSFGSNVTAVLMNVTVVQAGGTSAGFVTVYPGDVADADRPNASTVNPLAGNPGIAANFWTARLPTSGANAGTIAVFSTNQLDLVVDVVGYYSPDNPSTAGSLKFIPPLRVLDTRPDNAAEGIATTGFNPDGTRIAPGTLSPNAVRTFGLAGRTFGGTTIPIDVTGILAHVTIQGASTGGFVTLVPGDATGRPSTSTVNPNGSTAFNSWVIGLPTGGPARGTFGLYSTAPVQAIVDIVGYFSPGPAPAGATEAGTLTAITPLRVVDTRATDEKEKITTIGFNPDGTTIVASQLSANGTRRFRIAGETFPGGALPPDIKGVLANVTIVSPPGSGTSGFVTVFPGDVLDANRPHASTVNPVNPNGIAASFWASGVPVMPAGNAGTLAAYSTASLYLVVDVVGYFR